MLRTHSYSTQQVLRKIEWRVAAWAAIAFFALDLDRSNIQQANTDNFLEDLDLNTNGEFDQTVPFGAG